VRSSSAKRKV